MSSHVRATGRTRERIAVESYREGIVEVSESEFRIFGSPSIAKGHTRTNILIAITRTKFYFEDINAPQKNRRVLSFCSPEGLPRTRIYGALIEQKTQDGPKSFMGKQQKVIFSYSK